jgi:hypothetical protein
MNTQMKSILVGLVAASSVACDGPGRCFAKDVAEVRACLNDRATVIAAGDTPDNYPLTEARTFNSTWTGDLLLTEADFDPVTNEEPLESFGLLTRDDYEPNVELPRAKRFSAGGSGVGNIVVHDLVEEMTIGETAGVVGDVNVTCRANCVVNILDAAPRSLHVEGGSLTLGSFKNHTNGNVEILSPIVSLSEGRAVTVAELEAFPLTDLEQLTTGRLEPEIASPMTPDEEAVLAYLQAQGYAGIWKQCVGGSPELFLPVDCIQRLPVE